MGTDIDPVPESDTLDVTSIDWEAVASLTGTSEVEFLPDELERLAPWDHRRMAVTAEEDAAFMERVQQTNESDVI